MWAKYSFCGPPCPHLASHKITLIQVKNEAFAINVVYWLQATGTDLSASDLAAPTNPSSSAWKRK